MVNKYSWPPNTLSSRSTSWTWRVELDQPTMHASETSGRQSGWQPQLQVVQQVLDGAALCQAQWCHELDTGHFTLNLEDDLIAFGPHCRGWFYLEFLSAGFPGPRTCSWWAAAAMRMHTKSLVIFFHPMAEIRVSPPEAKRVKVARSRSQVITEPQIEGQRE